MSTEKNSERLDSYDLFMEKFGVSKEDFYQFGMDETILPTLELIDDQWECLKKRVRGNEVVYIRGSGRDGSNTGIFIEFYKHLFNNSNIKRDTSNNYRPQKSLEKMTKYKRNKTIFNFQVSHIFGRTKNPLLFEASWNIAFIPKIIDPFTGHETKGTSTTEFQEKFNKHFIKKYKKYIDDYNGIVDGLNIEKKVNEFLKKVTEEKTKKYTPNQVEKFKKGVLDNFKKIDVNH